MATASTNSEQLDNFTPTTHSEWPPSLDPTKHQHPADHVVLVIGGQRNIGSAAAFKYAQAGVRTILLTARNASSLDSTIAQFKRDLDAKDTLFRGLECDPANNESVQRLAETIKTDYGRLDIVIFNAGYSGDVVLDITKTPPKSFKTAADVNYIGTFHAMHHLIPLILSSPLTPQGSPAGKSFICIGSIGGAIVDGPIANAQYCISKLGQARLCEYASLQFKDQGLLVGCVHPGAVNTDMARDSKGAEEFLQYCTDSDELAGAFSVWLTSNREDHMWLSGRLVSATWDVDELVARKDEIVSQDLLKAKFTV